MESNGRWENFQVPSSMRLHTDTFLWIMIPPHRRGRAPCIRLSGVYDETHRIKSASSMREGGYFLRDGKADVTHGGVDNILVLRRYPSDTSRRIRVNCTGDTSPVN